MTEEQVIEIWRKNAANKLEIESFSRGDTITIPNMLPGFSLVLADVFPQEDA